MKKKIIKILREVEKKEKIKILFAVENGSRTWRIASKDSDYDIRFVFVRPIKDYIQINVPEPVINIAFDEKGNKCSAQGSLIDISGFDIFKYVKLLSGSNPTAIEWLISDTIYSGKQNNVFKNFALKNFNPVSLYYHYKSMCRNNYLKYIKSGEDITYKRYLYALRGLINAKWVVHKKSVPPIIFSQTFNKMKEFIPSFIINKLKEIIQLKSQGKEKEIIENIVKIDSYVGDFLKNDSEILEVRSYTTLNKLDNELRKIVLKGC